MVVAGSVNDSFFSTSSQDITSSIFDSLNYDEKKNTTHILTTYPVRVMNFKLQGNEAYEDVVEKFFRQKFKYGKIVT